jgi:glycosyltransferase involved in cell wall biosynthesis
MAKTLVTSHENNELSSAARQPLTVCFPFIGDKLGGSHMSALGLIKNLDPKRFRPLVVLHETDGPVAELFRREGVAFESAPARNRLERARLRNPRAVVNVLRTLPAFRAYLKSHRVAIVHTNDGRTHVAWGLAARLAGAKLLWHHRGDDASIGLHFVAPWLASHVASVSRFASPPPGVLSAARKSSVIHSPFDVAKASLVDRETARAMVLKEIGEPAGVHILGYVGTLVTRKRPLVFVEAIAALKALAPHLRCVGVFLGSALNELDEAAREKARQLGVDDRIRFLGYRYPGEAWIAGLDALLVPSVGEPLGRTLVEAMLLGTPVIASDSGGNPEAIAEGETGRLVAPDDPQALAAAYLELIDRPVQLATLVANAREDARFRFSTERHVNSVTAIYETLTHAA